MSKMSLRVAIAALVASTAFGNVFADDEMDATLHIDKGSIMTSEGGDFVTAADRKRLDEGQRVMVTEDSKATLVYDNGCREELIDPGVYVVDEECVAGILAPAAGATAVGAATATGLGTGTILGIGAVPFLVATAAVVSLMLDGEDDGTGPRPVSP